MSTDAASAQQLPEHPELREIAMAIESAGVSAEILDSSIAAMTAVVVEPADPLDERDFDGATS